MAMLKRGAMSPLNQSASWEEIKSSESSENQEANQEEETSSEEE